MQGRVAADVAGLEQGLGLAWLSLSSLFRRKSRGQNAVLLTDQRPLF